MDFIVERNDIAKMEVDAIVLPANPQLRIGPGASKAIFDNAGSKQLEKECAKRLNELKKAGVELAPGMSVVTHAYNLSAQVIVHTIVPKWRGGDHGEYDELCMAYLSALKVADRMGLYSIAFPLLASGNMGFDIDVAVEVAMRSIEHFKPENNLSEIYLVTYGDNATRKMRDLGFEVKEHVNQMDILDQKVAQAGMVSTAGRKQKKASPVFENLFDDAIEWLKEPENCEKLIGAALSIMKFVTSLKSQESAKQQNSAD